MTSLFPRSNQPFEVKSVSSELELWRTVKSKILLTLKVNRQPLDKNQGSKFFQLGVKQTNFQNPKGSDFLIIVVL